MVHERPGESDDKLGAAMRAGEVKMHVAAPAPAQVQTGLLKNAFLAACLHLRGVPMTISAAEIRAELVAARDTRQRRDVQLGPRAKALRAARTGQPADGTRLALLRTDGVDQPAFMISLAGTVVVEWPFPDVDPIGQRVQLDPAPAQAPDPSDPSGPAV